jgi:hypothetical protein
MAPLVTLEALDCCDGEHSLHEHFNRSLRIESSLSPNPAAPSPTPVTPPRTQVVARKSRGKKRVRFNLKTRAFNPVDKFYDDTVIATKWFTSTDLLLIKENAKNQSATIRRSGPPESCSLTLAYRKTSLMLAKEFKELVKLSTTSPDQDLREWCAYNDGRRGLERFTSREYCYTRRADVVKTREAVLAEQDRQIESGERDDELIAKASREITRRARTFALFVAEADSKQQTRPLENPHRVAPSRKRSKIDVGEIRQGSSPMKQFTVAAVC